MAVAVTAQYFPPMFVRPDRIAAAVGFKGGFMILKPVQERQDRGLIVRQANRAHRHVNRTVIPQAP